MDNKKGDCWAMNADGGEAKESSTCQKTAKKILVIAGIIALAGIALNVYESYNKEG